MCVYICIHIYIYIEREREIARVHYIVLYHSRVYYGIICMYIYIYICCI